MPNKSEYQKYKSYFCKYHREYYHRVTKKGKPSKYKGEYCVRLLVRGQKRGHSNCYGLTIPANIVNKYKLFGKVFKIKTLLNGKFILYTKLKEKTDAQNNKTD